LRVKVSDITAIKSKYDHSIFYELIGQLQSGLKIFLIDYDYDLRGYIGSYVEVLLFIQRSPYLERGRTPQLFTPDKYYSIGLIDELVKEKGYSRGTNEKEQTLVGDFIDSYHIPEKWIPRIKSSFFLSLLKNPSALRTEDGIFLLSPVHLSRRFPIEKFPQKVSISTGRINLIAWHPL
jgi:hypothetical protein